MNVFLSIFDNNNNNNLITKQDWNSLLCETVLLCFAYRKLRIFFYNKWMAEQQFQIERVHMNSGDQSKTMVNASMYVFEKFTSALMV